MSGDTSPRALRREAAQRLRDAGVASAEYDADELLAFVLGRSRSTLPLAEQVTLEQAEQFRDLVVRRARREPLQHLTGSVGFRHVELVVGPGVFVPRPETELLAGWAVDRARELVALGGAAPVVVDLCTGSGAVAKAIADEVPRARVYAVELDPGAHAWAERNLAETQVELRCADMADAFPELDGIVDVVTCNPPYIPLGAWESVAPEARDHDPPLALFSGDDGLDAFRVLERRATRLLRSQGRLGAEHADLQGQAVPALFAATGRWAEIVDHDDLAGRPRFVTARLAR